jgi:hypothetical protein
VLCVLPISVLFRKNIYFNFLLTVNGSISVSETNVMHFLFNLLRIMGLYMLKILLVHPQEVPHKRHLIYCVRVMSVGFTRINPGTAN